MSRHIAGPESWAVSRQISRFKIEVMTGSRPAHSGRRPQTMFTATGQANGPRQGTWPNPKEISRCVVIHEYMICSATRVPHGLTPVHAVQQENVPHGLCLEPQHKVQHHLLDWLGSEISITSCEIPEVVRTPRPAGLEAAFAQDLRRGRWCIWLLLLPQEESGMNLSLTLVWLRAGCFCGWMFLRVSAKSQAACATGLCSLRLYSSSM